MGKSERLRERFKLKQERNKEMFNRAAVVPKFNLMATDQQFGIEEEDEEDQSPMISTFQS